MLFVRSICGRTMDNIFYFSILISGSSSFDLAADKDPLPAVA